MLYWRSECYDSSGNHIDECEMTAEEMKDFYEWHKHEFFIPAKMTLEQFIKWQGFTVITE